MRLTFKLFSNIFQKIMKKKLLFFVYFFLWVGVLSSFYFINQYNQVKITSVQLQLVKHPEFLPKKEIAKYTSFWFKNARADYYWLQAIQYIWGNAVSSEYKKYLYSMLDLITELNPYFQKPYIIGQLLLPWYNQRYEELSQQEQDFHTRQWEQIGLKGIANFCDEKKVASIITEDDLGKLFSNLSLRNPCKDYEIAFQQGFINYFYLKDSLASSNFYKIASMNDNSVEWAKIMAAIMRGKSWEREKSVLMFLNLAQATKEKSQACEIVIRDLEAVSYITFQEKQPLSAELIKQMEDIRNEHFQFDEKEEENIIAGNNCSNYVNKAIRELNLAYIDEANETYFKEIGKNASTTQDLFDAKYISFQPTDFQQYDTYWISYVFNPEIGRFDYEMTDKK